MERVYVNGEHSSVLMKSMAKLWKDRKYCDAVLDINNENIELHKLILLAASPSVITKVNSITDRGTIVIKLEGKCYNKEAAKLCVQYLYKGIAKLTDANVKAVTKIAEVLELKEILKICSSFRETFKLYQEETSESDVDYGSDTEEDEPAKFADQITDNLTEALEEALGDIEQMEKQTDKGDPGLVTVKMEMPMESCLVEAGKDRGAQKPEDELASAIESIQESEHDTIDTSQLDMEQTKLQSVKQVQPKPEPKPESDIIVECPRCDKKVPSRNLINHIKLIHVGSKKFNCSICGKIYSSKQAKESHKQSVHTQQCRHCSRYVFETIPWKKGMDRRSKRTIPCKCGKKVTICSKVGRSKDADYYTGEQHKQSLERYACVACGKLFSTKSQCQSHSMTHNINNEKAFSCKKCDYKTSRQLSLREHELEKHIVKSTKTKVKVKCTKSKSLKCCYCGKEFDKLKSLKSHLVKRHGTE